MEFQELEIKFPTSKQICDLNDVEQAKILFRLANTQYRKALEYFNLEKYLAENISIKQDISKLYRFLALMETDKSKIFAIHDRRRELLESLINELQRLKDVESHIIEISVELSDVFLTIFDLKYDDIKSAMRAPRKQEFDQMN